MRRKIKLIFISIFNKLIYNYCKSRLDKYLQITCIPKNDLTIMEKQEVDEVWSKFGVKYNYDWFAFYKSFENGFSPFFIPQDIWNHMEVILNPVMYRTLLAHKGFLHKFIDRKYLPETLVNVIEGFIYDENDQIISKESAKNILLSSHDFVKKNSTSSGGGAGVIFYDSLKISEYISEVLTTDYDFICQKTLMISEELSRYNTFSVNTVRIVTLNLNNQITVVSSYMRMSASQRRNDNVCTGGLYIGVKEDGKLHDYALNGNFQRFYEAPSGVIFKGERIQSYGLMKEIVIEQHRKLPFLKFVAWDVTIDVDGNIRIIEMNLDSQNLEYHQPFNGPFFGKRTGEIIDYIKNKPVKRFFYA